MEAAVASSDNRETNMNELSPSKQKFVLENQIFQSSQNCLASDLRDSTLASKFNQDPPERLDNFRDETELTEDLRCQLSENGQVQFRGKAMTVLTEVGVTSDEDLNDELPTETSASSGQNEVPNPSKSVQTGNKQRSRNFQDSQERTFHMGLQNSVPQDLLFTLFFLCCVQAAQGSSEQATPSPYLTDAKCACHENEKIILKSNTSDEVAWRFCEQESLKCHDCPLVYGSDGIAYNFRETCKTENDGKDLHCIMTKATAGIYCSFSRETGICHARYIVTLQDKGSNSACGNCTASEGMPGIDVNEAKTISTTTMGTRNPVSRTSSGTRISNASVSPTFAVIMTLISAILGRFGLGFYY